MAKYVPTKRCDLLTKHDEHEWKESKVFARRCPGRSVDKLPARGSRAGHPRNRRTSGSER